MVTGWCASYFFNNALKCALFKCKPLSLMMALGQPYRVKMYVMMNLSTSRYLFVLVEIASMHFNT